jgi:hypothetical protein
MRDHNLLLGLFPCQNIEHLAERLAQEWQAPH